MDALWPILIVVGIIVVVFALSFYLEKRRAEALDAFSREIGFTFVGNDRTRIPNMVGGFELFNKGRSRTVKHLMYGPRGNANVYFFDYSYRTGSGKNSSTHSQTVVLFESEALQLPRFFLVPENLFHKIGNLFGYRDIDFDAYPEFSKQYLLRGEEEDRIRQCFNHRILSFFEAKKGLYTEGNGSQLLYYRVRHIVQPKNLQSFLDEAVEVYRTFAP